MPLVCALTVYDPGARPMNEYSPLVPVVVLTKTEWPWPSVPNYSSGAATFFLAGFLEARLA